jgi:RNA polymerase sigma-70 factor (ECF subfamily)
MREEVLRRSDRELVEAACAGDIDSFRELYERHHRMAVGIAYSRLSDQHLAEDAAQEAFAVACRRLSSLRNGNRFPEWLGTICRRTASRMARSQTSGVPLQRGDIVDPPGNNEERVGPRVRQALERLSASQREVIHLHYFSGLSYKEIAHALGTTSQAVHGRMQRARRVLARRLSEMDE